MKLAVLSIGVLFFAASCAGDSAELDPEVAQREQAIGVVPRGSTCEQLGLGALSFTLTNPEEGTHAIDPQNSLIFGYHDAEHTTFFFTQSTIRMTGVLASNGDRTMMWEIPGGNDGFGSLTGPPDPGTDTVHTPEEVTFCYDFGLRVQPSPLASFSRRASWAISKSGRTQPLSLAEGQTATLDYSVTARVTGSTPLGQFFHGAVFVENVSPQVVTVSAVTTTVGQLAATVTCPLELPFTMQPFTTIECSFHADMPDTSDRIVVGGGTVSHGLPVSSREVLASFSAPNTSTTTVDRCVTVSDEAAPGDHLLGSVCFEQNQGTFNFSKLVGPFACGNFSVTNAASFAAADTGASGTASWTVNGTVVCNPGCTKDAGYWRSHGQDPTWALIGPAGRNTTFFRSGVSYIDAMFVLPLLNPYWPLASEYIAARLNVLTGVAMQPGTADAFNEATAIFQTRTPLQVLLDLFNHGRIAYLTDRLRSFNEGHAGPGSCPH